MLIYFILMLTTIPLWHFGFTYLSIPLNKKRIAVLFFTGPLFVASVVTAISIYAILALFKPNPNKQEPTIA